MIRKRSVTPMLVVALSMSLVGSAPVAAQDGSPDTVTTDSPAPSTSAGPGIAEVALCRMPELGEPAGSGRPTLAGIAGSDLASGAGLAVAADGATGPNGSAGCRAPTKEVPGSLGGDSTLVMHTVPDGPGDGGLDILNTSWAEVRLDRADARRLIDDERIVVTGQRKKVLKPGRFQLIDIELASAPATGDSVNVATEAREQPARRTPSAVANPVAPLANVRDLSTLYVEEGGVRALSSDLSTGDFYTGKRMFAGMLDGQHALFLIPKKGVGSHFRPVTFQAEGGGPDAAGLGAAPGLLETSGRFGWIPDCIEQLLIHEPLVLEGIEVSASTDWVTFCFGASDDDLDLLAEFIDEVGDLDDVAPGLIRFTLVEGAKGVDQERPLDIWIEDDRVYLSFPIGLKGFGYHVLRDVSILPTEDPGLDALLGEAARTIARWLQPTSFDATAGRLQGDRECAPRPGATA